MKKINFNFIKFIFSFIFVFAPLFLSFSNAGIIEPNVSYNIGVQYFDKYTNDRTNIYSDLNSSFPGFKNNLVNGYLNSSTQSDYIEWFNGFCDHIYSTYNMNSFFIAKISSYYQIYFYNSSDIDFAVNVSSPEELTSSTRLFLYVSTGNKLLYFDGNVPSSSAYLYNFSSDFLWELTGSYAKFNPNFMFLYNSSIKSLTLSSSWSWNGETYFYQSPSEPEGPTLPSNAQIAQAVQNFYNSDYYKNNKDFKDFIVLYNTETQYFDFICHTLGNTLGQVILPPNYRYQGKLYDVQWWKFYIDENQGAFPYGKSYYLYASNDFGVNITDIGTGKISELIDLDFSNKSVIVYSTTDYPVRTYVLNEGSGDYTYTDGIIEGDQYTYNENLNPTTNGYNPLENFVTVDPSQTIIDNADFEGFSNIFNEHKDLFSFTESMHWLIVANNELSNYFLGFIVLCALFLTLSRILKG